MDGRAVPADQYHVVLDLAWGCGSRTALSPGVLVRKDVYGVQYSENCGMNGRQL